MANEVSAVVVNDNALVVKEYKGQRVVTLKDIDTAHGRPEGTARKRFNDNRKYFVEDVDFFKVCASEIRTDKIFDISTKAHEDIVLLTESGYFMIVKSFTDDLSRKVQKELVNGYFRAANKEVGEIEKRDNINALLSLSKDKNIKGTARAELISKIYEMATGESFSDEALNSLFGTSAKQCENSFLTVKNIINANANRFSNDISACDMWGKKDKKLLYVTKRQFDDICVQCGISTKMFLKWLSENDIIVEKNGEPTCCVNLRNKTTRCVAFKQDQIF